MISRCCLYRTGPSSIAEPNVRPGRIFTAGETGSYLCAACTCGQAISTALMREDESSPVEIRPAAGGSSQRQEVSAFQCRRFASAEKCFGTPICEVGASKNVQEGAERVGGKSFKWPSTKTPTRK